MVFCVFIMQHLQQPVKAIHTKAHLKILQINQNGILKKTKQPTEGRKKKHKHKQKRKPTMADLTLMYLQGGAKVGCSVVRMEK